MTRVYLGLGSNIEPVSNLRLGIRELRSRFGDVGLSPAYRAPAIGFDSADFLNLVARIDCDLAPAALLDEIEVIHDLAGRERRADSKWVARSLDIDLLLYGDLVSPERPLRVPRSDVLEYAFVLRPLAELAPDRKHPVTGRTFREHWRAFDDSGQSLTPVSLDDLRDEAFDG
ncbi:MAG: 2-amino-4-hydroxy-6-hydroxymethyldihydropteridine diphosphokinase [Pseudomonadota bacterium]